MTVRARRPHPRGHVVRYWPVERELAADHDRPATREQCRFGERPCPYVGCRHHLYLEIQPSTGRIKLNFPTLEPHQLEESCSLDVADRGGCTLENVGRLLNLTRERVRQVEGKAVDSVRAAMPQETFP